MGLFKILNPYQTPGIFRKAQLHLHTSMSLDVLKKIPIVHTVQRYKDAGYQFIVITDHDRVTNFTNLNDPNFIAIPGIEETIVTNFWPLGKHLLRFGITNSIADKKSCKIQKYPNDEIVIPAHLNWPGNFWTGRWKLSDLSCIPNLRFIEIFNRHSSTPKDLVLWHQLLVKWGPEKPIWGVAVDDTDNGNPLNLGWIMIKTQDISKKAFFNALHQGAFYASCGPEADFTVNEDTILVETNKDSDIHFINKSNFPVAHIYGKNAIYRPNLSEQFIRIEITNNQQKTCWSQPFYIIPEK